MQLYECVYLLVEGRCTYASPCCPSAPASPIATPQRYPSGQLLPSPKALPAHLPMVAQALGGTSSYALQDSSHHSSSSDRQAGRFFLSLTRNVSLEQRLPEPCACAAAAAVGGAAARAGEASSRGAVGVTQITDSFVLELPEAGAAAAADQSARRSGERSRHSLNLGSGITPAGATGPAGSAVAAAGIAALSSKGKRMMRSGHIFSLSALNVFGVYIGERTVLMAQHTCRGHAQMQGCCYFSSTRVMLCEVVLPTPPAHASHIWWIMRLAFAHLGSCRIMYPLVLHVINPAALLMVRMRCV